jgi:sigma-E factor negative regulatory protein RseA
MKERISAFIDGHFDDARDDGAVVGRMAHSDEARETWQTYCLIGDALRSEAALGKDLTASVMDRLEQEATVLSPVNTVRDRQRTQGVWHRLMPIAASVMGVAAVGWVVLQLNSTESAPVLAQAPQQAAPIQAVAANAPASEPRVTRDTALRAFVLAHQGTARGALPGVAPYVRTVAELPQAHQ